MRDLAGRTALLTGASRGLGSYIARALAAERMNLVLAALSVAELDTLAADLRSTGSRPSPSPPISPTKASSRAWSLPRTTRTSPGASTRRFSRSTRGWRRTRPASRSSRVR